MAQPFSLLLLEDSRDDAEIVLAELAAAGLEPRCRRVSDEPGYLAALESPPDLIIADYHLPQFDALRALRRLHERQLDIPVIVVTGALGEERAVECMREGAVDYLLKDRLARLVPAVERALAERALRDQKREAEAALRRLKDQLQAENAYLREELVAEPPMIGSGPALARVLELIEQVASLPTTVLVLGETGTGKELVARAIHARSPRRDAPLVNVNCAALPSALIENELFGHVKGAYTTAAGAQMGRFELANGGTLFLDEIGELPLEIQAKLLRVLQHGELERVGSPHTVRVDVRVVAATNRDLRAAVDAGSFRADLYYRVSVFPIEVPPLRERREDIPELARTFVERAVRRLGRSGRIPDGVMERLQAYPWPGNIRELENLVERALIVARDGLVRPDLLLAPQVPVKAERSESARLEDVEREHILRVLAESEWRIGGATGAAKRLGLQPSTLRHRMARLGIQRAEQS